MFQILNNLINCIRKGLRVKNSQMRLDKIRGVIDITQFVPPVEIFCYSLPSNKIVRTDLFPTTAIAKKIRVNLIGSSVNFSS
jgi:hypothetical protein